MSGGVDSTVSAVLLQEMGYEVIGVYMIMHNLEELNNQNIQKAQKVADFLGIKLHIEDIQDSFKKKVYDYFISSYEQGLTPNPCVVCNRNIKFGKMVEFADSLGVDKIATGHYVKAKDGFFYKGKDLSKDQSYFLAEVKKEVVNRVVFTLGDWLKEDVKKYAANIEVLQEFAKQSESSEICFVENSYVDILKEHFNTDKPGIVKDINGKEVGHHKGYMHYTIGKRRGFFVNGAHEPHFVVDLDAKNNTLIVGTKDKLEVNLIKIANINLFTNQNEFECEVKVRYRTAGVKAKVTIIDNHGIIELKEPVFGVAKGQFAVFYDNDRLLGGGEIVGV
jgi:tRNA-specific 2-thiouridylase